MKYYKYIKIVLIAIPILFLVYLFNKQFPWDGKLEIIYDFSRPNAFIDHLTPEGRVGEIERCDDDDEPPHRGWNDDDGYCQTMKSDPVYFDLELPANYYKATIELKYQSQNQPVIEIGGLVSKNVWNFLTKPIQNTVIDGIINKWDKIQQGDTILLQKDKKYDSIGSFLENLPLIDEIAVFNYNLNYNYVYPDYVASDDDLEINQSLKGKHSFYTYLGEGEELNFNFWLQDVNEHDGSDEGKIEIYRGTELVKEFFITDDGISDESQEKTDLRELQVSLSDATSGVYKINLLFTDDIIIKKIKTKQKLITFINKLNLYNQEELTAPINLFSNSSLIRAATSQVAGLQTIKIDEQNLDIPDVNKGYATKVDSSNYNIEIPKTNIIIQGSGLFGFSEEQFFDPLVTILNSDNKLQEVNYIIANYQPSTQVDGWNIGRVVLNLSILYKEKNKAKIMISAPNLDQNGGEIKITEIKTTLEGGPFLERIFSRLSRIYN